MQTDDHQTKGHYPSPETVAATPPVHRETADAEHAARTRAVFLGFGLCSRRQLATGDLPVDALAMIMAAEEERRDRGGERVIHLIADDHACVNSFAEPGLVDGAATRMAAQLRAVIAAFGFEDYEIVRASERLDDLFADVLSYVSACGLEPYAANHTADVEWARRRFGAEVKIGWSMASKPEDPIRGFDERYFDAMHAELFDPVRTVYTSPGRTADPERPRCSPYTFLPGERSETITRHGMS